MKRIVVLGGGIGGTTVANRIRKELRAEIERGEARLQVVDRDGVHAYQPGYLMVVFDKMRPAETQREERRLLHPAVELVQGEIERVDPARHAVMLKGGRELPYDLLVVSTGSVLRPETVPGLAETAYTFYDLENAKRLRDALANFSGGRIVVTVAGIPYKCPVAPLEITFLLDDTLRSRGLREKSEIHYTYPLPRVFGLETVATPMQRRMVEHGIGIHTPFNVERVLPQEKRLVSLEGETIDFDFLIAIPPHTGADYLAASGLGDKGNWVPTDRYSLQSSAHPDIFVLGDTTNLPISKAGSTADYEAEVVAKNVASRARGESAVARYDGRVYCWIVTGLHEATYIKFDYAHPPHPPVPSEVHYWNKTVYNRAYWDLTARATL